MKKKLNLPLLALLGMLWSSAFASPPSETRRLPYFPANDTRKIQGIVRDFQTRQILSGISVQVKGTNKATATDINGKFTLELEGTENTLVTSSVGYEKLEIKVSGKSFIDIELKPTAANLNEVVVVGYGTQKKGDVTSAVASVKSADFVKGSVQDAAQLIQGKVAGVSVIMPSGDPTANSAIILRGIPTLASGSAPLVLIDGIPGNLNTVAPENIESIDVLKDGSAAAIYGTRGTNGVILITTRRAAANAEPTLEYNGNVSTQTIVKKLDLLTAADYKRLAAQGIPRIDYGGNTDWLKAITRTPVSQIHNLSLRGGNSKTNYVAELNYRSMQGIFLHSDNKTLNAHINVNHSMFDGKLKVSADMVSSSNKYFTTGDGASFNGYTYRQAVLRNPTDAIKDSAGNWIERSIYNYSNPVTRLAESYGENAATNTRYSGSLLFEPIAGLKFKGLGAQTKYNQTRGYSETKKNISTTRDGRNGYASRGTQATTSNLLELTAEYSRRINDHSLTVLGGYSYQDDTYEDYYMQNWDFPTDIFSYNNIGLGNALKKGLAPMSSVKNYSNLIGFFGRLNYNYQDKYLLAASIRHEGSSKFGANHKFGDFPSISAGWRISKESFMQGVTFINDLKLRAGYGITGTAPTDSYLALPLLGYTGYTLVNGVWMPQLLPASNPNPDLRWEKKEEVNIGLDFSLFKNRISGSIDYYNRKTKDMLYQYNVPTPPYLYPTIWANVGAMQNKGLEVLLNFIPVSAKDFQWRSSVNFSTNSNKLVSLSNDLYKTTVDYFDAGYTGEPVQQATHRVQVGKHIGNFYGYKVVDITDDGKWIYQTKDGKTTLDKDPTNKAILGNGLPKYYAGWNNNFRYKNIDLNISMRGAFGFQILNFQRMYYENPTVTQYNSLKSAYDKVYGKAVLNDVLEYTNYYVENGNFLKIDNITLGYNFGLNNNKIFKAARVYVSTLNTFTITKYKGLDPEVNTPASQPLAYGDDDRDKYPTTRTYTLGLNLTF
ncbi:SusC/RagA family TonB-linked outer membrane protein [Flavitalea flava]